VRVPIKAIPAHLLRSPQSIHSLPGTDTHSSFLLWCVSCHNSVVKVHRRRPGRPLALQSFRRQSRADVTTAHLSCQ